MNIFHRRHLALFCAIFAATSICGCFLAYNNKLTVILVFAAFGAFLSLTSVITKWHRPILFKSALCILFAVISLLSQFVRVDRPIQKIDKYIGNQCSVTATVKSVNTSQDFLSLYTFDIQSINGTSVKPTAVVEFEYDAELEVGELVFGDFTVDKIDAYSFSSTYYKAKDIMLYLHSPSEVTSEPSTENLSIKIEKLNQKLSRTITKNIKGDAGDLVAALLLGNKDLLDDSIVRDFRRAGLSHILAISGMHLSVLIFFFDFILKKLGFYKIIRGGIVIPTALFYVALTGFASSTVRAFVMTAIVYLAFVLQDDSDLLTTLFFALFVILAISPNSVYDIGLWLSFLAVVGIFVAQHFINILTELLYTKARRKNSADKYAIKKSRGRLSVRKIKITIYIFSSLIITFFANIFICVPAWLYFNEISLISLFTNLIAAPLVTVILYLSPIFMLTNSVPFMCGILGKTVEFLCNLLLRFISLSTAFSNITVSTKYSFTGYITIALAVALTICLVIKLKRKWIIFVPPIVAGLLFSCLIAFDTEYYQNITQIDYIGGKESEMLLLRSGNQYSIIDMSSGGSSHSYNAYVLSTENCATEIDSFVLTHYHNYHANSVRKLFKRAVVKKLYLPYPNNIDEYYIMSSVITAANNENADVVLFDSATETEICQNVTINLSQRYKLKRSTHPTFYFTLNSYDQNFVYFSESAFEAAENLESAIVDADLILLGAHGPKTKSDFTIEPYAPNRSIIISNTEIKNHFASDTTDNNVICDVIYSRIVFTPKKD